MTLSLAVTAAALAGGITVTYAYDRRATFAWRIPDGLCIGLAALGLIGLALAMRWGLSATVVATAAAITGSPSLLVLKPQYRRRLVDDASAMLRAIVDARTGLTAAIIVAASLCVLGVALLWRVAGRSMFVRADGIYTGVSHNIGDLPFHLTVMSRFLYGQNFPPEHPSFAGAGFTYPFLSDVLGAMQLAVGGSSRAAIVWPLFALLIAFAALLFRWTLELTASRTAAFLSLPIAFFSGGLGWWSLGGEARASGLVTVLAALRHDYTITADGAYRWGNLLTALLVTQRGLLLGLPLALIIFRLWWESTDDDEGQARMIAAGVIAGMLPLVHAHSYAVVLAVAGCLAIAGPWHWKWVPFFAWSLSLGLPQIWWLMSLGGVKGQSFLALAFGWDRGSSNIAVFWLRNTGVFIPLLVAGLLWRSPPLLSPRLRRYYLPFILCFIVPNVLRLAPWIWDNIKVLVYWFIASVPIVAIVLARLFEARRWRSALAAALLFMLTAAGALDVWRVASGAFASRVYDREGIEFARLVRERTAASALIAHAPTYNHPVALSGRRSFMGYPGHLWSHGLDAGGREADIRRIYAGGAEAEAVLKTHHIDYLVVGPQERRLPMAAEPFFARYPLIVEAGGYRLYRIEDDRHQ
ncbi:MAG TPA: hypothetical protein VFJ02_06525 [Vicinamibacterales bacterium]|nr:hypothetical protein [Vicinamibacterales bacterium]